jgi:hypothetical protein
MRECLDGEPRRADARFPVWPNQPLVTRALCGVVKLTARIPPGSGGSRRGEQPIANSFTCSFVAVQL